MTKPFDIAIIGGGINGCGCAADAALRGLSVALYEKGDLASQTSSNSTKLIHGGLRYLEQWNFSLVRKALIERQHLLNIAPHLVHPIPFVLPQLKNLRSSWLLRIGLFLYDNLNRSNHLPKSGLVTRIKNPLFFKPLVPMLQTGLSYTDCATNDARLTIENALQAKQYGAEIHTQTEVIQAKPHANLWQLSIQKKHQPAQCIQAKAIINAAGPWVENINHMLNTPNPYELSLIKGSHLIVKKLYEGEQAYVLQHQDHRIVFTIPYFGYTLIGTTDVLFTGTPEGLQVSDSETEYLLALVATYFGKKPSAQDIITSYSGVRTLVTEPHKNAQTLTRDYRYHSVRQPAPCISIYSGKLTTFRLVAEKVIDTLRDVFPHLQTSNTTRTPLPGAIWDNRLWIDFQTTAHQRYSWLDEVILNHYLQTYGTRTEVLLKGCQHIDDLGIHFAEQLYQREVDYLISEEWATSVEDILWRRTKFGLNFSHHDRAKLEQYILLAKVYKYRFNT